MQLRWQRPSGGLRVPAVEEALGPSILERRDQHWFPFDPVLLMLNGKYDTRPLSNEALHLSARFARRR